jgi:hypothetical protein
MTAAIPAGARLLAESLGPWAADILASLKGQVLVKTGDQTFLQSNTTLQDESALQATIKAGAVSAFLLGLHYNSGVTPDIKIGWSFPTGLTMKWTGLRADTAGALTVPGGLIQTSVVSIGGLAADGFALFAGRITGGAADGLLKLQAAQNTSNASDTKILDGSFLAVLNRST